MKVSRLSLLAAAFAGLGVVGTTASRADLITVASVPVGTSDFGYLAPGQTYALGVDLNGPGETINGVTFAPGGRAGTGAGGVSYTLADNGTFSNYNNDATDTNVHALLANFFYNNDPTQTETLTINGLTPGKTVTLVEDNAPFGNGATGGRNQTLTASTGATTTYQENNGALSTVTYSAIVPASGSVSISSVAIGGDGSQHYYGFTVAQTPEPASLSLLALGGVGLLARRRRTV